jgi:hypothetical protein
LTEALEMFDLSSIGIELDEPTEPSKRTDMLIYGRHRVGKTTFCAQAAEVEGMYPVLWVAAEDGTGAFAGKYPKGRIQVAKVSTWDQIQSLVEWFLDEEHPFKTIVIDTLGQVQEIIKRDYLMSNSGKGDFAMWDKVNMGLVWLLDSIHNSPYNGFYIAHTDKVKDDTLGTVLLSPYFLGKKSSTDIPKIPDTIAYLAKPGEEDEDGKQIRVLQLTSTERVEAGSRYEHKLPSQMVNPKLKDYFELITAAEAESE